MVCSLFFWLILYYYLSSVFCTRRYYNIKHRFPIKSHASQRKAWTDSEELTQWCTRRSKNMKSAAALGQQLSLAIKLCTVRQVCVRAYYCLCLIGTWHWRASLTMLHFFFWLYGCESDVRRVGPSAFTPWVLVLTSLTGTALTWDYI